MAEQLERDLGLYATITVSLGAVIGSGIFVLPGLAAKIAGVRAWFSLVFKSGFAPIDVADGADLVIVSTSAHHLLYDVVFGAIPDRLAAELDCTVLMVHSNEPRRHAFLRYLLERVAF